MPTIPIECLDSVLISLKETFKDFARAASKVIAVKLYEMGKLSSGRAAELAGISRISFLQSLAEFRAPIFDLTKEELKRDLQNAWNNNCGHLLAILFLSGGALWTFQQALRSYYRSWRKGLVPALKPVIKKLLDLDFRLKPELIKEILALAGEEWI